MSNKKKIILTIIVVIFDIALLISILVIRNATMNNYLDREVNDLVALDFTKDRYNTELKTSGGYGKIENTIKEYLDNYAVLLQSVLKDIHDERLTKVLSFDNYKADGPEFKDSLSYISQAKESFNTNVDKLIADSNDKNIISYGEKNLNSKQLKKYKELMLSDKMLNDFKDTQKELMSTKVRVNNIYDTSEAVLNFLVKNKDNWKLENGEIKFKSQTLYNEYNNMIKKIK